MYLSLADIVFLAIRMNIISKWNHWTQNQFVTQASMYKREVWSGMPVLLADIVI